MDNYMISIKDIGLFIIFCVFVVGGVYFTITMINLNKLIVKARNVIDKHDQSLDAAITSLPQLVNNSNDAMIAIKGSVDKVHTTIGEVEEVVAEAVVAVSEKADNVGVYFNTATDIIKIIADMFTKSNRK